MTSTGGDIKPPSTNNKINTWGDETTMNLNPIIYKNIFSSQYFKDHLYNLKTYHEVLSEIHKKVTTIVPFFRDNIPSTAYCLLLKLWTLRLTVKQINNMLNIKSEDGGGDGSSTVYPRAIALLYLRYVAEPNTLWDWFEPWLNDNTPLVVAEKPKLIETTIGEYARDLLLKQKFHNTMLPRIPVKIHDYIENELKYSRSNSNRHDRQYSRNYGDRRGGSRDYTRHREHSSQSRSQSKELDRSHRRRERRGDYDSQDYDRGRRSSGYDRYNRRPSYSRSRSPPRDHHHHSRKHSGNDTNTSKTSGPKYDEFGRLIKNRSKA